MVMIPAETIHQQEAEARDRAAASKAQLDAVYRERNLVVALAAKLALSHPMAFAWLGRDPDEEDGWQNVVYITVRDPFDDRPMQLSWHIHDREVGAFSFLPDLRDTYDGQVIPCRRDEIRRYAMVQPWDGHTTEEKYQRILRFVGADGAVPQADGSP